MEKIIISIIIPNYNQRELLKSCIGSIKKDKCSIKHEIIVVDNGSNDGSIETILQKFPDIRVISNKKNMGFSKAVNQGIRRAKGDYILLLNNDTLITDAEWLAKLLRTFEKNNLVGIVGSKLIFPDGKAQYGGGHLHPYGGWWNAFYPKLVYYDNTTLDFEKIDEIIDVDFVIGAVLLTRKEVIEEIGLLDEGYSPAFNEEFDWCIRAKLAGYRVVYNPKVSVVHLVGQTEMKMNKDFIYAAREKNDLRYILLNFPAIWLLFSVPTFLKQKLGKAWRERRLGQLFRAWMITIGNLGEIWPKRRARMKLAAGWGRLFKC